ncbi:Na+/H+ antiporter NhaC family protein [Shewanella intestini]|uniref:Sodium:proton antiporter n=1 Tax=Shewanella intestini TaxID=2017544 RepID=A0ABS5HZM7_9GAMM|nr:MULTISPECIES: Na+/H+ antiporter NhaC family protein [Shewanella]MBR9726565.1 sodium:proton antiporter [Shewanella intestini]MRG34869.1 sodium:proton antiporter [Shewanella sp. XMDDZSB0408]
MLEHILILLPLLLTLTLALIVRHTLLALSVGILSGSIIVNQFHLIDSGKYLVSAITEQFYAQGQWQAWHLNILAAMILLGVMTQLLTRGGAVKAFADWLYLRIKSDRQARLGVVVLGWIVFIDGIFSCLTVGHVCQPLSERYQLTKAQIAYLVDSNASPLCALLPFSSWGPYVMAILATITFLPTSPLEAFIQIATLNFYSITVLFLSLLVAWFGIGFSAKPTRKQAIKPNKQPVTKTDVATGNPWLLGIPMLSLLIGSIGFTLYSGITQSHSMQISQWLGAADIGNAMKNACLLATIITILMLKYGGRSSIALLKDMKSGVQVISFAVMILLCTWLIGAVINDLGVGKLLASWATLFLSQNMLVAGAFLLCALMAFTTGSSWGTFAIMIPLGAQIASAVDINLLLPVLSAVMSGSVFGDHCSPISDTSVLSATSSGCAPHEHVITQLPFALIAATSTLVGFQMINLHLPPIVALISTLILAGGLMALLQKRHLLSTKTLS